MKQDHKNDSNPKVQDNKIPGDNNLPILESDNEKENSARSVHSVGFDFPDSYDINDLLRATPEIPKEVYNNLPKILKKGTDAFPAEREKDVFLIGAITLLSGCFPTYTGLYNKRTVYANLNCLIAAPPGNGKGSLRSSKDLVQVIQDKRLSEYQTDRKQYKQDIKSYKHQMRNPGEK